MCQKRAGDESSSPEVVVTPFPNEEYYVLTNSSLTKDITVDVQSGQIGSQCGDMSSSTAGTKICSNCHSYIELQLDFSDADEYDVSDIMVQRK